VCEVLGDGHEHSELAVLGTYEGRRVEALARHVIAEPGSALVSPYICEVRLRSDPGGRQWLLQAKGHGAIPGRPEWEVATHSEDLRKRLQDAGVVEALEATIGTAVESDPKILYLPEDGTLTYRESSGATTDADTIRRRLDTLLSLDAINRQCNQG